MIEQIMFFALGALCAGLISISILPAFWRRAERLVRKQLERQLPLSPREITAGRDQLRSEFSVELRRSEQRAESAREARSKDQIKIGEHLQMIARMGEEATDLHGQLAAMTQLSHEKSARIEDMSAEIAKGEAALADTQATLGHRIAEYLTLEQAHQTMVQLAQDRAEEITGHKTHIAGLQDTLQDSKTAHTETQKTLKDQLALHLDLQQAYQHLAGVADERRLEISNQNAALDLARARIDEQQKSIADLRQTLQQKSRDFTNLQRELTDATTQTSNLQNRLTATLELATRRQETIESKNDTLQSKSSALSDAGQQMALLRAEMSAETQARKRAEREALAALKKATSLEDNIVTIKRQSQETARDLSRTIDLLRAETQAGQIENRRKRESAIVGEVLAIRPAKKLSETESQDRTESARGTDLK